MPIHSQRRLAAQRHLSTPANTHNNMRALTDTKGSLSYRQKKKRPAVRRVRAWRPMRRLAVTRECVKNARSPAGSHSRNLTQSPRQSKQK